MDRNSIIGMVLIMGIVLTWFTFFAPEPDENQRPKDRRTEERSTTSEDLPETPSLATLVPTDSMPDSLKAVYENQVLTDQFGDFAAAGTGEEKLVNITTDLLDVAITTKGGRMKTLKLLEYKTYHTEEFPEGRTFPLIQDHPENEFSLGFITKGDHRKNISTGDLFFTVESGGGDVIVGPDEEKTVTLRASVDKDRYLEFIYSFKGGSYNVGMEVNFVGMDKILKNKSYEIHWVSHLAHTEKSIKAMREKSGIYYKASDDVDNMNLRSDDPVQEKDTKPVEWVGFNGQFFTNTLMSDPDYPFTSYDFKSSIPPNELYAERMEATLKNPIVGSRLNFYTGPAKVSILKKEGKKMSEQVYMGYFFLQELNAYIIYPAFRFLERMGGEYWLIILLLAFTIRLMISPLTYKAYISQSKMRVLNQVPEIKKLEEKYKNDPTKLNSEKMGIYRQYGVSMFGGCLPMIIQWPFLVSLFFFFPALIELRQVPLLWADDLSSYDSVMTLPFEIPGYGQHVSLFTLLMAVTFLIYSVINQKTQVTMQNNPMMKYLPYFMPLVMLVFLNGYASGLSYYYFLSTLMSITQTTLMKVFVKDEKLMEMIMKSAKEKKASGKKSKVEAWMEKQQKRQKEMTKARGK